MEAGFFAAFLLTAGALAAPERPLDDVAEAIQDTLDGADEAVARAAEDLGRTGLRGRDAHDRLASLCEELSYAVACGALDARGVLVSEAPGPFTGAEGQDLGRQPHVRRLHETGRPVLSDVFRSVEGVDAISLAHPVLDRDGAVLGSISVMARPASLVAHAIQPLGGDAPEVMVMQTDGHQLYEADREEVGRNLLTDPIYEGFPELREVGRRSTRARTGSGEYRFLGRGLTPPVHKRVDWTTVGLHGTEWRVWAIETLDAGGVPVVRYDEPAIPIPAEVGLDALVSLSEGHLARIAGDLSLIATGADVRSGDWARIREPLARVRELNLPGVYFYADRDGTYWTLDRGRAAAAISERPYFDEVVDEGRTVVGELVVGKTMGRNEAVVAVPVEDEDGEVVGLLGASVFLDQLSARIADDLGLGEGMWFYAFDANQRLALYPDPDRIFLRAGELGPQVEQWFTEMQRRGEGVMRYTFEGKPRTLVFRRSALTGWTYAFGFVGERKPGA